MMKNSSGQREDRALAKREPIKSPFYSNAEAAAFLQTLEKYRVVGGGPRFHKLGRRVLYKEADLRAWADAKVRDSTCDRGAGS